VCAHSEKGLVTKCIISTFIGNTIFNPLQLYLLYPVFAYQGMSIHAPLPGWSTLAWQIPFMWYFNDFGFYWAHRMFHAFPSLYKLHKQHHTFTSTIGFAAEYAHPLEAFLANGLPTIGGALILGVHMWVLWLWLFIRIWETVEAHSGYVFKYSPIHILPGSGGAKWHGNAVCCVLKVMFPSYLHDDVWNFACVLVFCMTYVRAQTFITLTTPETLEALCLTSCLERIKLTKSF